MEGKVTVVGIVVSNQAKALAFYTEKAGFEKRTDLTPPGGHRYVTVAPKGEALEFALWEAGSGSDPSQKEWSKHWAPARAPPVVIFVADCESVYRELSSRGVEFLQSPMKQPWGTVTTFKDPDGNLFSINQSPSSWSKP